MKKSALFLFVLLCFLSTYSQQSATDKNIEMYTSVWDEIINDGQIDKINNSSFDPEVTLISSPENIVGIDAFKSYYQNYLTGFSDITFTIVDVFGEGDKIVKHWNFKGTHSGDFFGIPATGKTVDVEGVTLVKMKDGKIAQEQDFMDNTVFLQQLGLISNPENMQVIDKLYKSFASGDMPSVLAAMDPKIQWNEAEGNKYASGNPYIGPDAVLNGVFIPIGEDHEYFNLTDIDLQEMSNNQVFATLRYNAKLKNGKAYDAQVAHLWTLNDGRIIAFQQYTDTKKLAEAENK